MYDVLDEAKFRALYDAVWAAKVAGTRFVRFRAGDTEFDKEQTVNVQQEWPAIAAEFRIRFPNEVGRQRVTRTAARFQD